MFSPSIYLEKIGGQSGVETFWSLFRIHLACLKSVSATVLQLSTTEVCHREVYTRIPVFSHGFYGSVIFQRKNNLSLTTQTFFIFSSGLHNEPPHPACSWTTAWEHHATEFLGFFPLGPECSPSAHIRTHI